ncbi:hypothetical protein L249_1728 [Ophiocordyceps polyrhachis-furcata BCC 54312]|uniref:SRR1-like domain-containing protein n=1 Tax=Ophiocordyceps polyrhachis-furcata BCC 54312 TaxID=1330021 RepID=A0A367LMX1_9HYPO|nr:hypothetical protein L249_1728 [Ophiocordyceps polyrhachis-furcata BCC 54312]
MTIPGEIEDASTWTFVRSRRRGRQKPPSPPPLVTSWKTATTPSSSSRTTSDLAAENDRLRSAWEQTSCCASLRRIVSSTACRVRHAVCLGIGTFDPDDGGWQTRRTSFLQLAAFSVMVEELAHIYMRLEKISGSPIQCVFQEPLFTPSDREFLAGLGHHVVDSPEAFRHISHDSFLFGVHLYRPVYAMALDAELPVVFVGTGWHVWESASLSQIEDLHNLQAMDRSYAKAAFPQDPPSTAFSGTTIYWRPTKVTSPTAICSVGPQG